MHYRGFVDTKNSAFNSPFRKCIIVVCNYKKLINSNIALQSLSVVGTGRNT
jgi:hypothetical protein